jgi:cobalt-zinc-cadmium efflux system membrane fusion protein
VLDEEVGRLPPLYRQVVILCDLQGRTRKQAAQQLRLPEGTVATRLTRARSLLAKRLLQRGAAISGTALASTFLGDPGEVLASSVVAATARAAACFSVSQAIPGAIPARVAKLSEGVLKTMSLAKHTRLAVLFLMIGAVAFAGGKLGYQQAFGQQRADGTDRNAVRLTPDLAAHLGIQTTPARSREGLPHLLRQIGTINYDDESLFSIRPQFPAEVAELAGITEAGKKRPLRFGDRVKRGQLLAILCARELGERKSALVGALCKLRLSSETLQRLRKLADEGVVPLATLQGAKQQVQSDASDALTAERTLVIWKMSDAEIQELKDEADNLLKNRGKRNARTDVDRWSRVELRAPADGTIVETNTAVGDQADPINSLPLFKISDLTRLQISVSFPEEYTQRVRAGLQSGRQLNWRVRFPNAPDSPALELAIHRLAPRRGNYPPVLIGYLDNSERKHVVGEFVDVSIPLTEYGTHKPVESTIEITVPASAVVEQSGAAFVLIQPDPKKPVYEARRVLVVRRGSDVVHLRALLSADQESQGAQIVRPGERVVTNGATDLKAVLDDRKSRDR